jgi:Arm DNA-binding domain
MKGHIRERSPGHWAIVIEMRDPATGKRRRKWHSFAGSRREAQAECRRLLHELDTGTYIEAVKDTFADFLDRWLDDVRMRVTPKTHERYAQIAHKNVANERAPERRGRAVADDRQGHARADQERPIAGQGLETDSP